MGRRIIPRLAGAWQRLSDRQLAGPAAGQQATVENCSMRNADKFRKPVVYTCTTAGHGGG